MLEVDNVVHCGRSENVIRRRVLCFMCVYYKNMCMLGRHAESCVHRVVRQMIG